MLYASDDHSVIVEDSYGNMIKTYDARLFVAALIHAISDDSDYTKANTALVLLQDMLRNYSDLVVTWYGY